MPLFYYTGRDENGVLNRGEISASDSQQAANQLKNYGIIPISITEAEQGSSPLYEYIRKQLYRVSNEDLNSFCRQMYALLRASIPINQAIKKVADGTENPLLQESLYDINKNILAGQSLSESMRDHRHIFNKVFINTIAAGESGGKLEEVFMEMSRFVSFETRAKKRFQSAIRYPIIVLLVLIGALITLTVFVIPQFAELFASLNTQLPLATRIIIAVSNFIINNGLMILIALIVSIVILRIYFRSVSGRFRLHRWLISMPILGNMVYQIVISRFARIFTILYRAGVPLNQTLRLTGEAIDNDYVSYKIEYIRNEVTKGESLSAAVTNSHFFPPLAIQMLQSGEESGMLEDMLIYVAEYYETEVDYDLARLEDLLTPVIILILGAMIMVLALGVFLPIWSAVGQIGQV